MSEEKKLTDEEVVKALERCIDESMGCVGCPYHGNSCRQMDIDTLYLIHRLQSENADLREKRMDAEFAIDKWMEENEKQKAEIERLTEENGYLKQCADNFLADYQKAQKQVDELKANNEHLYNENTRLICEMDKLLDDGWDIMDEEADAWYKKGGKDTAKEIYTILEKWVWKLKNEKGSLGKFRFAIETVMQEIKEKYSLEVANFKLVELKKGGQNEKV